MVLAIDATMDEYDIILDRIDDLTREYNLTSRKPYQVAISIGAAPVVRGEFHQLENLMQEADEKLYQNKKAKREKARTSTQS